MLSFKWFCSVQKNTSVKKEDVYFLESNFLDKKLKKDIYSLENDLVTLNRTQMLKRTCILSWKWFCNIEQNTNDKKEDEYSL